MVNLTCILYRSVAALKKRINFFDSVRIYVRGGAGGHGLPKYGGIGGRGGNVYAVGADVDLKAVVRKFPKRRIVGGVGGNSRIMALLGTPGFDTEIQVPPGVSIVKDDFRVIGDINKVGDRVLLVAGGDGGGAANEWQGRQGSSLMLRMDLKLIADIGLVGFPNAGKSTLLRAVSRAAPKVADYPFTTVVPNLGIMQYDDHRQIIVADLPGLIEGAFLNVGMGHRFLKHVERTNLLLFVVDIHGFKLGYNFKFRDAFETILLLFKELELYKKELMDKPAVLALNKMDVDGAAEEVERVMHKLSNIEESMKDLDLDLAYTPNTLLKFHKIFCISANNRESVSELKESLRETLDYYAVKKETVEVSMPDNVYDTHLIKAQDQSGIVPTKTALKSAKKVKRKLTEHRKVVLS